MKQKRAFSIVLIFSIITCLFTGCRSTKAGAPPAPVESENKTINILFIGNSLTYVGKIQDKFTTLAKSGKKSVNVTEKMGGGAKLSQHLDDLKTGKFNDLINNADVVILQEYGGNNLNTANSITEIQKLFKDKTKFYFLLTEFDIPRRLNELKQVKNITYMPSGYAHNLLVKDGFTYAQLHSKTDYHPNDLYGYIGALTVYSVVFNADCTGLPYDFIDNSLIPGNNDDEKKQSISKIQKKVMEAIKAKYEDYK